MFRWSGIDPDARMDWITYARAVLAFNLIGALVVYLLQRTQGWLPLNSEGLTDTTPDLAFNTAISFATNTNWQSYGGETTMSVATQMLGLGVQNFTSAATGLAVLAAIARALSIGGDGSLGNFWVDVTRNTTRVLLPLSLLLAVFLISQGVIQTFEPYLHLTTLNGTEQTLALGPVASQEAIKQLGTNGGGYFNVNSAHPFENPTPLSNLAEMVAILWIPAACCIAFGRAVGHPRHGWTLLGAMTIILIGSLVFTYAAEATGHPALGVDGSAIAAMEGKEVRFGIANSASWAVFTTAASNGSVNSMHDSFTPLGGLVPLWLIQLGEVVFGGVGSGLYGMLMFAIVAVFIAGLMVGRTPEYLGKKVEPFEMAMASVAVITPCAAVLLGTALAVGTEIGRSTLFNPGPHGFSEALYALSSASNNNGSAFAGIGANNAFYNTLLGTCMFIGRYAVAIPALAIASSLGLKRRLAPGPGTLPTDGWMFGSWLVAVVLLVGALTFLPALALGPIAEHVSLEAR